MSSHRAVQLDRVYASRGPEGVPHKKVGAALRALNETRSALEILLYREHPDAALVARRAGRRVSRGSCCGWRSVAIASPRPGSVRQAGRCRRPGFGPQVLLGHVHSRLAIQPL